MVDAWDPTGHRYGAQLDYEELCSRYGAESYHDFSHEDLEQVAADIGCRGVATIAQHELIDRWDIDHPRTREPLDVSTVAGKGSGILFGVWGITVDATGPDGRSPVAATYHETGHKLDELVGRERDVCYPTTYGDLIATEMRATLAMSRFEDRLPAALGRVAQTVQERQELYRIKKGGGSPLYGPDPADMSMLEERAEDWAAFLREADLLGHQIGYPLAVYALDHGYDEAELVWTTTDELLDAFDAELSMLQAWYNDPITFDTPLDDLLG